MININIGEVPSATYLPLSGGTMTGTLTTVAVTIGGAVAGGDQAFTNVGDMTFATGSILASGSTNGNTLLIRANDTTFITLTTGATDACTMDAITMSGTWLASGTVTLPAVTLGGEINANSQLIYSVGSLRISDGYAISGSVDTGYLYIFGGTFAAGSGASIQMWGKSHAAAGQIEIQTPNAAGNAQLSRLKITGVLATAVATWTNTTQTGLKITSGGDIDCAGTGASGWKIKNPKNAAATALSGTQLDVEIDIGGTPYYFTVYPTKA